MHSRKFFISLFILVFTLFALPATQAVGASIKDRMKARIPAINSLKETGTIGENNKGFLQFLGKQQPQKGMVDAENNDRKQVYTAISRKQGVAMDLVGQRRAKQIAKISKPGHMYQSPDGKWHKK